MRVLERIVLRSLRLLVAPGGAKSRKGQRGADGAANAGPLEALGQSLTALFGGGADCLARGKGSDKG